MGVNKLPRPKTKQELLDAADKEYSKLWKLIDDMNDEMRLGGFQFEDRDRSIKDVLIHLYEWHKLAINWVTKNLDGIKCPFLPEPYNWKTYPAMNVEFTKQHKNTTFDDSKTMIEESHQQLLDIINQLSNEELFTKKYYNWTGTTSVGSYLVSASSSHYDWAQKKIKKHIKTFNQ